MVNKKITTPTCEESDEEGSIMEEICAPMEDLQHKNQTLKDNAHHLQQHQQEIDMVDKLEALDP